MGQKQAKTPPKTSKIPTFEAQTTKRPSKKGKGHPNQGKTPGIDPDLCQSAANVKQRRLYHARTPAQRLERMWRRSAVPPTPQQGSKRSQNPRHVALAKAYCDWSDTEAVVALYRACAVLNELGMGPYHVDHAVPLVSPLVCGLHTHTNLRISTAKDNLVKGNLLWPDMWPQDWGTMDLLLQEP